MGSQAFWFFSLCSVAHVLVYGNNKMYDGSKQSVASHLAIALVSLFDGLSSRGHW